jgi:hypothetical protein
VELPVAAVYDANVLYTIPVCDCLMWVAVEGLVRAHWSAELHEEWMRNLLIRRPDLTREQLERRRNAMETALPDALITGYRKHIRSLQLPDPGDRHVVAAAITARATHIVTYNVKDFPRRVLTPLGVEATHPDDFLTDLYAEAPERVLTAVRNQRAALKRTLRTPAHMVATFRKNHLKRFATLLEDRLADIG